LVTTRIQTTRRHQRVSRPGPAERRRLHAWPLLASVATSASSATAGRFGLASFGRVYAAGLGLLVLIIAYLLVGTQTTQTSYELDRLQDQNTQLVAEQDDLRAQDARMHTQAGVAQAATAAGLQHTSSPTYVGYQPVALDLGAPIGPDRPEDTPLWQRALAFIVGGTARDAQAAGR
jgi:hypothetical protein